MFVELIKLIFQKNEWGNGIFFFLFVYDSHVLLKVLNFVEIELASLDASTVINRF